MKTHFLGKFLVSLILTLLMTRCSFQSDSSKNRSQHLKDKSTQTNQNKNSTTLDKDNKFDTLAQDAESMESTTEAIKKAKIIRADVVAHNPMTSISVRDFKVNISQIDNSKFPDVSLVVSVTDKNGNPLVVNKDFFQIIEHDVIIPKENIISVLQKKDSKDKTSKIPLNVILAIDKSSSMAGEGKYKEKIREKQPLWFAMQAAINFIDRAKENDLISVIAFDGDIHPLGTNQSAIPKIKELKPAGYTALYGALFTAVKRLEAGSGIKAVILLSDGKNDTRGSINRTLKKIRLQDGIYIAENLAVPVFTIGFGKGFNEITLKKIARDTHALYFKTAEKEEIIQLYKLIRRIINTQYVITYRSKSLREVTRVSLRLGRFEDERDFTTPEHVIRRQKELLEKISIVKKEKDKLKLLDENLNRRMGELNKTQADLDARESKISDENAKLKKALRDLQAKEDKLNESKTAVLDLKASNEEQQSRLTERQRDIDNREAALNDQEKKLGEMTHAQDNQEKLLENRDESLRKREEVLANKIKELKAEKAELRQQLLVVENKEAKLDREIKENTHLKTKLVKEKKVLSKEKIRITRLSKKLDDILLDIRSKYKEALENVTEQKRELEGIKP
ncbi:MAG TPA: VWA domain-containing protein [Spirochaetes bacterium]|nr:VWA domain-containing protein [Spirochaetota bacterium]